MDPKQTRKLWKHGLIAAFIGGFATSIDGGLLLIIVAPDKFNLGLDLVKTLLTIISLAGLSGFKVAAAYLMKSPLPPEDEVIVVVATTPSTK